MINKFCKTLKNEFESLTPALSEKVKNAEINTADVTKSNLAKERKKVVLNKNFWIKFTACACAVVVICLALTVLLNDTGYYNEREYVYTMDINPSFSFVADSNGKIISVTAENRDAEVVLSKTNINEQLIGKDAPYVLSYVAQLSLKLGYFTENGVNVEICSNNEKSADLTERTAAALQLELGTQAVNVVSQTFASLIKKANEQGANLSSDSDFKVVSAYFADKRSYLSALADSLASDKENKFLLSYKFELVENYLDLLKAREKCLTALNATAENAEEILNKYKIANILEYPLQTIWTLYDNLDKVSQQDLKDALTEFSLQLAEMQKLGLNISNDILLDLYTLHYSNLDYDKISDFLTDLNDFIQGLTTQFEQLATRFDAFVTTVLTWLGNDIKSELEEILQVSSDALSSAQNYISKMSESFAQIYERRLALNN